MHFTYRSKVFLSQSGRYRWSGEATALSCTMRMQDHLASVTPLQVESPSMWVIIFKWDILITSLSHPGLQNTQKKEVERMTTQKTRSSEKCCLLNKVWLLHTWTHRGGVMFTWPRYLKIPAREAHKVPLPAEQWLTMENWWERENHSSLSWVPLLCTLCSIE